MVMQQHISRPHLPHSAKSNPYNIKLRLKLVVLRYRSIGSTYVLKYNTWYRCDQDERVQTHFECREDHAA